MKKVILSLLTILLFSGLANAQTNPPEKKMADLSSRPADHLMIQFGTDSWTGGPDSVKTSGIGRHFNIYFMMDKPFRPIINLVWLMVQVLVPIINTSIKALM